MYRDWATKSMATHCHDFDQRGLGDRSAIRRAPHSMPGATALQRPGLPRSWGRGGPGVVLAVQGRATRRVSLSGLSGDLTDRQPPSINVALLLAEANPRSVVTINTSSWLANST